MAREEQALTMNEYERMKQMAAAMDAVYQAMPEPFITPIMEAELLPRCDRCQAPGEFRGGRCSGCIAETQDRDRIQAAADEVSHLAGQILTTQHLPDDQMRRLVKIRAAATEIKKTLAGIPAGR